MALPSNIFSQKNVVLVPVSGLTGISLPAGSKKGSRMMSAVSAKLLLEMECDKTKATLAVFPAAQNTVPVDSRPVQQPVTVTAPGTAPVNVAAQPQQQPVLPAKQSGYIFSATNFDDGWTGIVKEDWVQVVKGSITVLLHYPTTAIDVSSYDYKTIAANAWNTLVSARYGNLQNFAIFSGTLDYERPYFVSGDVTDNATGKNVHVVLFKKGNNGWTEIISPDKNSFIQSFGIDISKVDYYADGSIWEPLKKLSWYNRFALAPADIQGKWNSNFTGLQQYVNAYTGANAGMDTYSSSQIFEFETSGSYKWELSVASGFVGSIKFQNVKSAGVATLPSNWQIYFSDLEGKPKTYNAYFSCIKGARILWLEDAANATGYTGYAKM